MRLGGVRLSSAFGDVDRDELFTTCSARDFCFQNCNAHGNDCVVASSKSRIRVAIRSSSLGRPFHAQSPAPLPQHHDHFTSLHHMRAPDKIKIAHATAVKIACCICPSSRHILAPKSLPSTPHALIRPRIRETETHRLASPAARRRRRMVCIAASPVKRQLDVTVSG
jgi:hypothetical protein